MEQLNLVTFYVNRISFASRCIRIVLIMRPIDACVCCRTASSVDAHVTGLLSARLRRNTICRCPERLRRRIMDGNFCGVLRRRKYSNSNKM